MNVIARLEFELDDLSSVMADRNGRQERAKGIGIDDDPDNDNKEEDSTSPRISGNNYYNSSFERFILNVAFFKFHYPVCFPFFR